MQRSSLAFAQLEKTRLVKKLKAARDRASQMAGRGIEGRKGHTRGDPELVALAKSIWREGRTLLQTSEVLGARGHVTAKGKPFSARR